MASLRDLMKAEKARRNVIKQANSATSSSTATVSVFPQRTPSAETSTTKLEYSCLEESANTIFSNPFNPVNEDSTFSENGPRIIGRGEEQEHMNVLENSMLESEANSSTRRLINNIDGRVLTDSEQKATTTANVNQISFLLKDFVAQTGPAVAVQSNLRVSSSKTSVDSFQVPKTVFSSLSTQVKYEKIMEYDIIEPDIELLKPLSIPIKDVNEYEGKTADIELSESEQKTTQGVNESSIFYDSRNIGSSTDSEELNDMQNYQPLDSAYYSELEMYRENDCSEIGQGKSDDNKSNSNIPIGFFDDEDADAAVRGVEAPSKRRKHAMEKDFLKFSKLMDIEMYKNEVRQNAIDVKHHEQELEDQKMKQKLYEIQVDSLKKKWLSIQLNSRIKSEEKLIELKEQVDSDEDVLSSNEIFDWRSKSLF